MMNKILLSFVIILYSVGFLNCQMNNKSLLNRYKFNDKSNLRFSLDKSLNEISGLADAGDNLVYAHNDENGIIFKVDITNGLILFQFSLGSKTLMKDFEGIATVKDIIYLTTSDGILFKFQQEKNRQPVEYDKIKTGLKQKNDVEGLCYDPENHSLLLACKDVASKKYKKYRVIYEFDLSQNILSDEPRFLISLQELKDKFNISDFSPSGIERHPLNGNFFIVSANEPAIVEISSQGEILNAVKLSNKKHRQTEGITVLKNNSLILSDEAKGKKAKLTIIDFE